MSVTERGVPVAVDSRGSVPRDPLTVHYPEIRRTLADLAARSWPAREEQVERHLTAVPLPRPTLLGPLYRVLDEGHEERIDWHHPNLPLANERPGRGEWSLVLELRSGSLELVQRGVWRERLR